ncbi:MAG: single-stranded DNA-binding protein, partial [Oceanobacter sp.]
LKKGSKAYFEGKLRTREWEKDGVKRYTTEIIANDMMMLDGRGQDAGMGAGNMGGYQQPGNAAAMMNPGYGQPAAPQAQPSGNYQQAPQGGNYQQPSYQQAPAPQAPAQRPQAPASQPSQQAPSQPMPNQSGYQQAPAPAQQPSNSFDDFDDDIPF